ncbi:MAG TPA: hypothetical protein VKR55_00575 [Bradyrhizobium sp.]|uniref:hypothetical protein n=1 Tax=Bradyrhizobium sp. TaxID=376 RepID=UPI002CACFDFF|nr:hypothetical protein [Bradyrhizobium sp.]HLZ00622.1 hypothetical protein [Bradyrhizobium sp.]
MTSFRQIEANRRNAQLSTGPITEDGKGRSRQNAVRHGLTAETVIHALEDAEDYAAFETAVTSDYDAQSAVERELVLRLASLLWRLRRATAIETGLFEIQARQLLQFRKRRRYDRRDQRTVDNLDQRPAGSENDGDQYRRLHARCDDANSPSKAENDLTRSFVHLTKHPSCPLDRLSRYEATLWRQACQILLCLQGLSRRRPWERLRRL